METIYLILVIVLFALAISDLIVGVSNDAVNFLNSAIGSKVAPLQGNNDNCCDWDYCWCNIFKWDDGGSTKRIFHPNIFIFRDHDHFSGGDDYRCHTS